MDPQQYMEFCEARQASFGEKMSLSITFVLFCRNSTEFELEGVPEPV